MTTRAFKLLLAIGGLLAVMALLAACGGGGGGESNQEGASSNTTVVKVTMTESDQAWGYELDKTSVPAGEVTFQVKNEGTFEHELMVYPSQDVSLMIPMMVKAVKEGKEVEHADMIDGLMLSTDGEDELELEPGDSGTFTVNLTPGTYELGCMIVETVGGATFSHYDKGMHATLTVR